MGRERKDEGLSHFLSLWVEASARDRRSPDQKRRPQRRGRQGILARLLIPCIPRRARGEDSQDLLAVLLSQLLSPHVPYQDEVPWQRVVRLLHALPKIIVVQKITGLCTPGRVEGEHPIKQRDRGLAKSGVLVAQPAAFPLLRGLDVLPLGAEPVLVDAGPIIVGGTALRVARAQWRL